jgi:hypothetical protein
MIIESLNRKCLRVRAGVFELLEKYTVTLDRDYVDTLENGERVEVKAGTVIAVPRGFMTDFATIPRLFWFFLQKDGRHSEAALVHDYLYTYGKFTRRIDDHIFRDIMKASTVKRWQFLAMFWAVRIKWFFRFGACTHWGGDKKTND